jgi:hypothetical protein
VLFFLSEDAVISASAREVFCCHSSSFLAGLATAHIILYVRPTELSSHMASDAIGHGPLRKDIEETQGHARKHGDLHQDVEVGPEIINIDRIEKVYK